MGTETALQAITAIKIHGTQSSSPKRSGLNMSGSRGKNPHAKETVMGVRTANKTRTQSCLTPATNHDAATTMRQMGTNPASRELNIVGL